MRPTGEVLEPLVTRVIDAAFDIHRDIGGGLLESAYQGVFARELEHRDMHVEVRKRISFEYRGAFYPSGFTLDLLVERCLPVELKSVEVLAPVHHKQLLTYLRLMDLPLGLLINFGGARLSDGLRRIVNNYRRT